MIKLDGNYGEGGGQIVRNALALSAITQKPFEVDKIRQGREKSGLKAQHLHCIKALEKLCGAKSEGAELEFKVKSVKRSVYSRVSPEKPLVLRPKNKEITRIAVFPKKIIQNAEFSLTEYQGEEIEDVNPIGYYSFNTNLNLEDIEKIFVEFKVRKQFLEEYLNVSLFVFEDNWEKWDETSFEVYDEDEEYVYYRVFLNPTKSIALAGKEESGFFKSLIDVFS